MKHSTQKLAIVILMLLTIVLHFVASTYARYVSTFTGDAKTSVAKWAVRLKGDETGEKTKIDNLIFKLQNNNNVKDGKIAPGATAVAEVEFDLKGTEVSVDIIAEITTENIEKVFKEVAKNVSLTAEIDGTKAEVTQTTMRKTIVLPNNKAFTAENGTRKLTLTLTWDNTDESFNEIDTQIGQAGETIVIPVKLTIQQHIESYIGDAINADKYGDEVMGYECSDPEVQTEAGAWRLFYQNADYTYLISDNKIELSDTLENLYTTAGWNTKTGADVSKIGQELNPMFKEAGGFTSSNTNDNIKGVGYLTNPEQWEKYKGPDAIFAIGGPSIELFVKSFNAAGKAANDERVTLSVSATSAGYEQVYSTKDNDLQTKYNHGIYRKSTSGAWWLVSPRKGLSNLVCNVVEDHGYLNEEFVSGITTARPIVCIPTNTFNEKYKLAEIVTEGLMRYYDARNNLGKGKHSDTTTTWKDLSGHQDGIIGGGANFTENCLQLDGEDDWVNLGEVSLTTGATVEAQIKMNKIPTANYYIISNFEAGGIGLYLQSKVIGAQVYVNGYQCAELNEAIDTDKIYNLSATYDGTTFKLYVDGVLKATKDASGTIGQPKSGTVMAIGAETWEGGVSPGTFANIDVYSARIYDRALTQEEIQQNIKAY